MKLKLLLLAFIAFVSMSSAMAQTKDVTKKEHAAHALYQCPMHCEGDKTYEKAGKCPVCGMSMKKMEKKAAVYQCPMKCEGEKVYNEDGKCPVCKMQLTKQKTKKG